MRVLITGSRYWTAFFAIKRHLDQLLADHDTLTIVHGACPTGADWIANIWAANTAIADRVTVEKYPADWNRACDNNCHHRPRTNKYGKPYCPMAGHLRNQKMVDLGADLCLAFPLPNSRGTKDCIHRAKKAGITVTTIGTNGKIISHD